MQDKLPKVSVVIPSLDGYRNGNVPRLLDSIKEQDYKDIEIILIKGVAPASAARNKGVKEAKGKYIIFIDDDISFANNSTISNLIKAFDEDQKIGLANVTMMIPMDSTFLQRRMVKECSFAYLQMVSKTIDTALFCSACQAVLRKLYFEIGGQNEDIFRGEDVEFFNRVLKAGYRVVLAANSGIYHPIYVSLWVLIKSRFINGFWGARDQVYHPHLIYEYGRDGVKEFKNKRGFLFRILRFIFERLIFSLLSLKFIRLIFYVSYGLGRLVGLIFFGLIKVCNFKQYGKDK
jgi:GT2 family glycosyltransferase